MDFSGKVAVVAGAGAGGIGEGIAAGLAEAGAKVVVADTNEKTGRETVDKAKSDGRDAHHLSIDISSEASAKAMADAAAARYSRIGYLVNNAALFGGMAQAPLSLRHPGGRAPHAADGLSLPRP
jgi:NAD(P)-dependent dehydrogenase (short-subunit alcohol dehydrogenase family)